jgi:invasion protein IalB
MHPSVNSGRHRLTQLGLAAALAAPLIVAPAFAKDEAKKPSEKTFQDWTMVCQKPEGAEKEVCVLVQQLVRKDKEGDTQGAQGAQGGQKLLMQIEVVAPPKGDQALMAFTLPLGVPLAQGLAIQIDDREPTRVPFQVCLPNGCQAVLPLKDDAIANLKGGKEGKVTLNERSQNPASLPVSLKGFSAGYKALQEARK